MTVRTRKARTPSVPYPDRIAAELAVPGPRWDYWRAIEADSGPRIAREPAPFISDGASVFHIRMSDNPRWTYAGDSEGDLPSYTYHRAIAECKNPHPFTGKPLLRVKRNLSPAEWEEALRLAHWGHWIVTHREYKSCPLCGFVPSFTFTRPEIAMDEVIKHILDRQCPKLLAAEVDIDNTWTTARNV